MAQAPKCCTSGMVQVPTSLNRYLELEFGERFEVPPSTFCTKRSRCPWKALPGSRQLHVNQKMLGAFQDGTRIHLRKKRQIQI